MKSIKAVILNETIKLISRKKYQALLVLTCLFSIAITLFGGFAKGLIGLSTTNTPLTSLSIVTGFLLPLMIFMAAADLFTAEQENGSIKAILTRPVSRMNIFISKVFAIILYAILVLFVCLVTSIICGIVFKTIALSYIGETLLAYAVSIVPMLSIILFAAAVSQLCKSSSSTVMLSVFGYTVIAILGIVFSSISQMLFTSYTGWYKLFIGATMPVSHILNILTLLVAYTLIFFAVGSWAFEKKEY